MLRAALIGMVGAFAWTTPSHAAGKLVYSHRDCSTWTLTSVPDPCLGVLMVSAEDGSGATRITDGAVPGEPSYGGDSTPDWSPDGRSIAFTRVLLREPPAAADPIGRGTAVWTMKADGSGQRQVLSEEDAARFVYQSTPMWTADGERIVFTAGRWDQPSRLYSVRADGTDLRAITPEGVHAVHPAVAPDGGVTYMTEAFGAPGSQAPHGLETTIWRADPVSGEQERIFFGDLMLGFASISPTGRWMALHTARAGAYRIQTLDLAGGGLVDRLPMEDFPSPSVWGGPERLLLNRNASGELYAFDLQDGGLERLARDFPRAGFDWHPGTAPQRPAPPDEQPPVVITAPPPKAVTAAAGRVRRYARIPLIAADGSGIARIEASLARVTRRGCRPATPAGRLAPTRSCGRVRWRTIDGLAAWRRMTDPLPRGRYELRVRARDTEGNRSRGARVRRLSLLSTPRPAR